MKKHLIILLISLLHASFPLFSQIFSINQTNSDFNFVSETKTVIQKKINFYDVEHGRVFDHTDNPRTNSSQIYFFENGSIDRMQYTNGVGNELSQFMNMMKIGTVLKIHTIEQNTIQRIEL